MRARSGLRSGLVLLVTVAALSAMPARAQVIKKSLGRSFNECQFQAPYVFGHDIFTATGTEALLTFSRTHTSCSERCQQLQFPLPDINSCDQFCFPGHPCEWGWTCSCNTQFCAGYCVAGVDVLVGYVVVLKADRFCSIGACSGVIPLGCPPTSTCDGSGTCTDATSNAKALCLCPDPACPIGQRICDSVRPTIPAADLGYEAFSAATNSAWVLGQATITNDVLGLNGTANTSSLAQVRFATVPGEEYAIVVKWTINPITSGFQTCPDATLLMSLDTRPNSCGP